MTNYTDEQRNAIMEMPPAVLQSAMVADPGSKVANMREFFSGEKFISEAASTYPRNGLILYMLKNVNLPRVDEGIKHMFSLGNPAAMQSECQRKIDDGLAVIANDEEGRQFKVFLLHLAENVVNAAADGFFGNQGDKVSPKEAAYVEQLKQKLGVAP